MDNIPFECNSMFLILESYDSVRYISTKIITGIAYGSYSKGTAIDLASSSQVVPLFAISDGLRGGSNHTESVEDFQRLIGDQRVPAGRTEEYDASNVRINGF